MRMAAALILAVLCVESAAAEPAKHLFGGKPGPAASLAPEPLGSHARGCLAGAAKLPETGPTWQAMRLERNRNWGHPDLVAFVERLGAAAQRLGWEGIFVGDLSQPRGGPMTSGHSSHQIGLDADIWLRPGMARELSFRERSEISSFIVTTPDHRAVNERWTPAHMALIRAAAEDPAVARIFVHAAIKDGMCRDAGEDTAWLGKVRPWWGHNAHFHVRLACPAGAAFCEDQAPPPPGDGCDESLAWWFSDEALNPKPGPAPKPKPPLTLADLPAECAAVLEAE